MVQWWLQKSISNTLLLDQLINKAIFFSFNGIFGQFNAFVSWVNELWRKKFTQNNWKTKQKFQHLTSIHKLLTIKKKFHISQELSSSFIHSTPKAKKNCLFAKSQSMFGQKAVRAFLKSSRRFGFSCFSAIFRIWLNIYLLSDNFRWFYEAAISRLKILVQSRKYFMIHHTLVIATFDGYFDFGRRYNKCLLLAYARPWHD